MSSLTAITDASEVNLSIEMASLPSAGTMARSAWGMITRRRVNTGPMPSEFAATTWLLPTDLMPPRMISPAKAASFIVKPIIAVTTGPKETPALGSAV